MEVVDILREGWASRFRIGAPLLILSMLVGILVAIFQAVTQIHEQSLSFILKMIVVVLILLAAGGWMLETLKDFTPLPVYPDVRNRQYGTWSMGRALWILKWCWRRIRVLSCLTRCWDRSNLPAMVKDRPGAGFLRSCLGTGLDSRCRHRRIPWWSWRFAFCWAGNRPGSGIRNGVVFSGGPDRRRGDRHTDGYDNGADLRCKQSGQHVCDGIPAEYPLFSELLCRRTATTP